MPDKYSELLTVLLVLRDREEFTFRWLKYAYDFKLPFNLLIADGGSNDVVDQYIRDNNLKDRLKIDYIKTEYDVTRSIYYRKINNALKLVNTPYVIFADNDDFFSIEGLKSAVSYLDKAGNQYASCGGTTINFSIKDGDIYGKKVEHWLSLGRDYNQNKAFDRVTSYLLGGSGLYYNVHRVSLMRNVWQHVNKYNFNNIRMPELLLEMYMLASGRVKYLNNPMYFRQTGDGIGNSAMLSSDFLGEMLNSSWSSEVNAVFDIIVPKCGNDNNIKDTLLELYKKLITPALINGLMVCSEQQLDKKIRALLFKKSIKESRYSSLYFLFKNSLQYLKQMYSNNSSVLLKNKHKSIAEIEIFLGK